MDNLRGENYGEDQVKRSLQSVRSSSELYKAAKKQAQKIVSVDIVRDGAFDYVGHQAPVSSKITKLKAPIVTPQGALALGRLKNVHSSSAAMLPNSISDSNPKR